MNLEANDKFTTFASTVTALASHGRRIANRSVANLVRRTL